MGIHRDRKYDIFISYRRDGGENEAWKLKLYLEQMGYRVFMDREALRAGDFNEQLYQRIDQCTDFLLICSPNSLERCRSEEDWVRKEVRRALQKGKSIIPVWVNGFDAAELDCLPEELAALRGLQAVTPQNATYEESVRKLASYLKARPIKKIQRQLFTVCAALSVLVLAALGGFLLLSGRETGFPATKQEKQQVETLKAAASVQLTYLELNLEELNQALTACENYVAQYTTNDAAVKLECARCRKAIEEQKAAYTVEAANGIDYAYFSHLEALTTVAQRSRDYAQYIQYLETVVFHPVLGNEQKKAVLNQFSCILEQDAELAAVETFLLFLPVTDPESSLKDFLDLSKDWKKIPGFSKSWVGGTGKEPELVRRREIAQAARHDALVSVEASSGVKLSDYNIALD